MPLVGNKWLDLVWVRLFCILSQTWGVGAMFGVILWVDATQLAVDSVTREGTLL